jgi:hypothetical protein
METDIFRKLIIRFDGSLLRFNSLLKAVLKSKKMTLLSQAQAKES